MAGPNVPILTSIVSIITTMGTIQGTVSSYKIRSNDSSGRGDSIDSFEEKHLHAIHLQYPDHYH